MEYEKDLREYLKELDKKKPIIYTGDLNVAHNEIDLKNPESNHHNPGFTDEERENFRLLLSEGFKDTFRELHPEEVKYSWWSYRFHAREKGIGWRIDYFIVSERLMDKVKKAEIHNDIFGSDHCPVSLEIDL
jgi:exodeoxyribonuclease-3